MTLVPASVVMDMPMIVGAHTEDEVQFALDWAADSVESYCERKFAYVSGDVVNVDPHFGDGGKPQARLPNAPVWDVSQVSAELRGGCGLEWVQLVHYQWTKDGLLYDTSRFYGYNGITGQDFWSGGPTGQLTNQAPWPFLPGSLQVTYNHGFTLPGAPTIEGVSVLPDGVVKAVIRGASVFLDDPSGARDVRVGEIGTKYDPTGPAGWLDEKLLGEYRLVHL